MRGTDKLRDELEAVSRDHFTVFQSETGPIKGCRCGGLRLGQSYPQHVTAALLPVIARHMQAARADELTRIADAVRTTEVLVRRNDGSGVFFTDLLREHAAAIRTEQEDQT